MRRALGTDWLNDTYVGNTSLSLGVNTTLLTVDRALANPAYSGQGLYGNTWLLVASSTYRPASFNAPSGGLVTEQLTISAVPSGADYEIHRLLSPDDKDRCLNDIVKRIRIRREVGLMAIDGRHEYSMGGVGSPNVIVKPADILNVYYFANPIGSLDRQRGEFSWWNVVDTPTGMELRIESPVPSGYQIAFDAILSLTLGAGDTNTIDVPDERTMLAGAATKAYDLLVARAPGTEVKAYRERRGELAHEFSRLAATWKPLVSRKLEFDTPVGQHPTWWWD